MAEKNDVGRFREEHPCHGLARRALTVLPMELSRLRLLDRGDLRALFPEAEISVETVAGWPKSLVVPRARSARRHSSRRMGTGGPPSEP
jgi:hypothetical protein